MMESGLLPPVEAKKVLQQKLSSPVKGSTKSVTVKKTPRASLGSSNKKKTDSQVVPNQTKKRKAEESESSGDAFEDTLASRKKKQRRAN
ncbi:hypothetical protein V6N13_012341 [Hibiscus sabdariffa]|uniref:Uncharacterized protein n=1 Tax=Hibiscus sabdariffa TaxID=183260 RepID=A0ABR2SET2_9ROSI